MELLEYHYYYLHRAFPSWLSHHLPLITDEAFSFMSFMKDSIKSENRMIREFQSQN